MDVEAVGGGDGGPRRADSVEGALDIVPLELYDSARAKIDANLRWLFAKAYGEDHVPADLRDPFYTDQYQVEHIKPPVLHLLLTAELYCRVCSLLSVGEQVATLASHQSVLQALARRGICVREPDDTPVTHDDLSSTPIKMSSHIPLIDALMLACSVEMMSIERVVSSVKRFSSFSSSKELPFDMEDTIIFWINKVILKTQEIAEKELKLKQHLMESPCHQKSPSKWYWKLVPPDLMHALAHCMLEPVELSRVVRYRRDHLSSRSLPHLPLVEDLMKDVCDGAALLTVVHYYCPEYMKLEDICLKEVLSLSDSVYNIRLLREFSNEYLNRCLYLQTEDLLYAPPVLKHNLMVFIAELFWWFEVVRPDFVKPRDPQEVKDARALTQPKSSRPHLPISNATKRSFISTSPSVDSMVTGPAHEACSRYYLHPEESVSATKASPSHSPSHPLLPLRHRQQSPVPGEETADLRNRSNSLSCMDRHSPVSRPAWMERRQRPLSQMEMEWERMCGDTVSLARSISKDSLASNVISLTPRHHVNGQPLPHAARIRDAEDQEEELVAVLGPGGVGGFRESRPESFFLEPLQPAVLRPNKEKLLVVSKQEESGEGRGQRRRGGHSPMEHAPVNQSFLTISTVEPENKRADSSSPQPQGFFLHRTSGECLSPPPAYEGGASDSEFEEEEEDCGDDVAEEREVAKELLRHSGGRKLFCHGPEEEESLKLREDVRVREREDKESVSGRSSPCPSTLSQASSASTGTSRMTSFAERRMHRAGMPDGYQSTGSSQTTTPDGSESASFPPASMGSASPVAGSRGGVASELIHLRMQLEEKRRAIETQKKKMETLSARQRLQLGKAAFLHIVKKGRGDTLPHPHKQDLVPAKEKESSKDDACTEVLKARSKEAEPSLGKAQRRRRQVSPVPPVGVEGDNRASEGENCEETASGELDLSECSRSIELLNEAIGAIQHQMMQLSVQQDLLMRQTALSPSQETPHVAKPQPPPHEHEPKLRPSVQFVEISTATRRPPKLSSGRTPRTKPNDLKLSKDSGSRGGARVNTQTPSGDHRPSPLSRTDEEAACKEGGDKTNARGSARGLARNSTFRLHDAGNRKSESPESPKPEPLAVETALAELARERSGSGGSGKENVPIPCEENRSKAQLIEVDLSELDNPGDSSTQADGEQKSGLGFFFKDDQKAADELAKKRAAFLLKQQKKAEEARLRKQQLEAESELKRDEARRKAEEERVRKEEEKARRELIKQEYLRRKQQELLEEQGVAKPRPRHRKPRPKSLHRGESGSSTPVSLCAAPSGSSLSLASAATEGDSVTSGGGSQRGESVESFPMLSRNASRNMERDWDNGSTASSITSVAEYNGPRLFKEPSAKSNKAIIQNAIAHCCLAGKVNEAQKNAILEEIERCESNHLMILFRDGGCQFRGLYALATDTEEIQKLAGTGPRTVTCKMIDKLFKYSSDRKQFTVIPAKTVSASVDAITIHNHLWQVKRPSSSKRK